MPEEKIVLTNEIFFDCVNDWVEMGIRRNRLKKTLLYFKQFNNA